MAPCWRAAAAASSSTHAHSPIRQLTVSFAFFFFSLNFPFFFLNKENSKMSKTKVPAHCCVIVLYRYNMDAAGHHLVAP